MRHIHGGCWVWCLVCTIVSANIAAGLGPQHVLILVRQDSQDGLRIANAYRRARGVPFENIVYLPYTGPAQRAAQADFLDGIWNPTLAHIKKFNLDGKVHVWVTTPGLPYRIENNSISGAIHFGRIIHPTKSDLLGPAGYTDANRYAGVMMGVDGFNGLPNLPHRPLHMHLWAGSVEATLETINRSVQVDGRRPSGVVYLCDGVGPRSVRKDGIPRAKRLLEVLGQPVQHLHVGEFRGQRDVLGLMTGVVSFPTEANRFEPGAIADHLTSLGGVIDVDTGQMSCLKFLKAGASASFGAVVEPYNYPTKFPTAFVHAAYAAGFTAVESYWMGVVWPQEGLFVGDPLTRPRGAGPSISITSPKPMEVVGQELLLDLTVESTQPHVGVSSIDLSIDGVSLGRLGQRRLPDNAKLTLMIDGRSYVAETPMAASINRLAESLKAQLTAADFTVDLTPGALFVRSPRRTPTPTVSIQSSTPLMHAELVGGRFFPGSPQAAATTWEIMGPVRPGDEFELEWNNPAGEKGRLQWSATNKIPASEAGKLLAKTWRPQLPTGCNLESMEGKTQTGEIGAALRWTADSTSASQLWEVRFAVRPTSPAEWKAVPDGRWRKLADSTGLGDDFAWIRFGVGPRKANASKLKTSLEKLSDGLHFLRAAAVHGNDVMSSTVVEIPVVKRTQTSRLRLKAKQTTTMLGNPRTTVAEAYFEGGLKPSAVRFRIDEHFDVEVVGERPTLAIDPKMLGVGVHRVRASTISEPGGQEADDVVEFSITP